MANLKTSPKTIQRLLAALIPLDLAYNTSVNTKNITAVLTTKLATAGEKSAAMPLVPATDAETVGLLVDGVFGLKIQITDNLGNVVDEPGGNNIYARLTETSGVYTLKTYYNNNGVETLVAIPAGEYIAHIPYNFDLHRLPHEAFIRNPVGNNDGGASSPTPTIYRFAVDEQTIATLNTLANLENIPADPAKVIINMRGWSAVASSGAITVTGQSVVWNNVTAGFDLFVGDAVWFTYEYEVV